MDFYSSHVNKLPDNIRSLMSYQRRTTHRSLSISSITCWETFATITLLSP